MGQVFLTEWYVFTELVLLAAQSDGLLSVVIELVCFVVCFLLFSFVKWVFLIGIAELLENEFADKVENVLSSIICNCSHVYYIIYRRA